jgi:transcriptional regulator with PAS, ATPase and Fis domain
VERLGGTKPKRINIRVMAATNRDLEQRIREGSFRSDLYFRLNVINLHLTPLRERPQDIVLLANHYLKELNAQYETEKIFHPQTVQTMQDYSWPGNGRELRNAVEHAFSFSESAVIPRDALPLKIGDNSIKLAGDAEKIGLSAMMKELELGIINEVLEKYDGSYEKAARALKVHRTTLYKKLGKAGQSA